MGDHGPSELLEKNKSMGSAFKFLSLAVQVTRTIPASVPVPARTANNCAAGLVVSTSSRNSGASPLAGATPPAPLPLVATTARPYTPSPGRSIATGLSRLGSSHRRFQ